MQQHTERRQRKQSLRFCSNRDWVEANENTVDVDHIIWITEPLSIITETDVALSLADGNGRNFRREISVGEIEEATVELEWHGEWYEYRRIGNNEWRRTRRVE